MIKELIKKAANSLGYKISKLEKKSPFPVIEVNENIKDFIQLSSKYSMTGELRMYVLTEAIKYISNKSIEGDFVECGVWYGMLSRTMCEYVDFNKIKRSFYLFDTWGKMPGSHPNPNYQHDIFTSVKDRFSKFKNVHLIRGAVPNSFDQVQIKKIAYLGIDMNDGIAELATLEKFYDKVVSGGIIYFDDYGPFLKVRKVVDDFFKDKPESLLYFPSGNAIIIKI